MELHRAVSVRSGLIRLLVAGLVAILVAVLIAELIAVLVRIRMLLGERRIRVLNRRIELRMGNLLLDLSAQIRNLLQLLNRRLMALKRRLNHLRGSLLAMGQLFEALRVLLLLLKQSLVILACLLGLVHQLMSDLFDLMQRLAVLVVGNIHVEKPPLDCQTVISMPKENSAYASASMRGFVGSQSGEGTSPSPASFVK